MGIHRSSLNVLKYNCILQLNLAQTASPARAGAGPIKQPGLGPGTSPASVRRPNGVGGYAAVEFKRSREVFSSYVYMHAFGNRSQRLVSGCARGSHELLQWLELTSRMPIAVTRSTRGRPTAAVLKMKIMFQFRNSCDVTGYQVAYIPRKVVVHPKSRSEDARQTLDVALKASTFVDPTSGCRC